MVAVSEFVRVVQNVAENVFATHVAKHDAVAVTLSGIPLALKNLVLVTQLSPWKSTMNQHVQQQVEPTFHVIVGAQLLVFVAVHGGEADCAFEWDLHTGSLEFAILVGVLPSNAKVEEVDL